MFSHKKDNLHKDVLVDLEPIGRRIAIPAGQTLLDAARAAGIELVSLCGGVGSCHGCIIRLMEGELTAPTSVEGESLSPEELASGFRLACQATPLTDVKIDIPPESITTPQRLQIESQQTEVRLDPVVVPMDINLDRPHLGDLRSDEARLKDTLKEHGLDISLGYGMLRVLPECLRSHNWSVRLALRDAEVVAALPRMSRLLGLAVDVGTTKLAVYLVDLESGTTIAKGGAMNPQIAFGEDVVSRIAYANQHEDGREVLQARLVETLNALVDELCVQSGAQRDHIVEAVVVGNTAMHHLFSGLPVRQLGEAPYVPAVSEPLEIWSQEVGLDLAPGAWIYMPPNIAGYVGADHMALLIATRLWQADQTLMAVDIGTNTEITLATGGRLLSCSCASGPAFEGAHIRDGMRAAPGAIERVQLLREGIRLQTIGGGEPVGICGSGILDAIAQMLEVGVIDKRGALQMDHPQVRTQDGKKEFVLQPAQGTGHKRDIVVTRNDINEIQLAKGAIRAGVDILLREAGLTSDDLAGLIVAGAFGTYIDIKSAIRVGMFPAIPLVRFQQVGNAAGAGARDLLVSKELRRIAAGLVGRVEYIELTTYPGFMKIFTDRLYF
jgi:uncharacterized 2Fe-2S/4Fe-4S cluster protein (DUF4445 family)